MRFQQANTRAHSQKNGALSTLSMRFISNSGVVAIPAGVRLSILSMRFWSARRQFADADQRPRARVGVLSILSMRFTQLQLARMLGKPPSFNSLCEIHWHRWKSDQSKAATCLSILSMKFTFFPTFLILSLLRKLSILSIKFARHHKDGGEWKWKSFNPLYKIPDKSFEWGLNRSSGFQSSL